MDYSENIDYCIYCTQKNTNPSLEHIIPRALGGSLLDNKFKTRDVCSKCNNLLGLYADGLYIKSFFSQSSKWMGNSQNISKSNLAFYPLVYFGYLQIENRLGFKNCELWISPCKGRILHFHNNKDNEFQSYFGGNPKSKKKNPGVAIFINTTHDQRMLSLGLKSFYQHFKKVDRVVSHINFLNGIPDKLGRYPNKKESN